MNKRKVLKKRRLINQYLTDKNDLRRIHTLARLSLIVPEKLEDEFLQLCRNYEVFIKDQINNMSVGDDIHSHTTVMILKAGIHFITLQIRIDNNGINI